jgi:hypothetical protein
MQDSQKFYFPLWVGKGGNDGTNKSISLAHLYVQGIDSSGHVIHAQLYPGKSIIHSILKYHFGIFGGLISSLISPFLNRFFIGAAYFSSTVSGTIHIRFSINNDMIATGESNKKSACEFKSFIDKLFKLRKLTGFLPFLRINLKAKIGHSQHFGGTIPMKVKSEKFESDILGRPYGCHKVFVVDSTVLPSVPATPTTGLVMANAARIASSMVMLLNGRKQTQ